MNFSVSNFARPHADALEAMRRLAGGAVGDVQGAAGDGTGLVYGHGRFGSLPILRNGAPL